MPHDKQLHRIKLKDVLEKRRLDQVLNAKEFAVAAGISYSTARSWFCSPGFSAFRGVIFWQDFVSWRTNKNDVAGLAVNSSKQSGEQNNTLSSLPPRAARILQEAC